MKLYLLIKIKNLNFLIEKSKFANFVKFNKNSII